MNAYNRDPIIVRFTISDESGTPSNPTGTLRAWAVLSGRLVEATAITTAGNVVSCNFAGSLCAKGVWDVFLEETVSGTVPNIIGKARISVSFAPRP